MQSVITLLVVLISKSCSDIHEWLTGAAKCQPNSICENTVGSFVCNCDTGFEMKDQICVELDECTLGTDKCSENQSCINTVGSFTCDCNDGFNGYDFVCEKRSI